jgi:Tfp pilus assembly PilM family ATPase
MRRHSRGEFVCLDFGVERLSVLEVAHGKVTAWGDRTLPRGYVRSGDIDDPAAIGAVVKETLAGAGIKARRARLALPDEAVVIRFVKLPSMRRGELGRAMSFAIERESPFPLERACWSWDVAGADRGQTVVCVALAWRDVVERWTAALRLAGLVEESVEPRSMALARCLDSAPALVLDASPRLVQLTLLEPRRPPLVDSLQLIAGGPDLTQALERLMQRADRHLTNHGASSVDAPLVLAGDLETASLEWTVPVRPASAVLNGHGPVRPPGLPAGGQLANLGSAMR